MALNPGDPLLNGHYRILRLLGRGGFGFVYQAQDTLLGENVAIKELIPALVGDEATLKRFLSEARATMRLTHKRIVRTHNVFSEGGNYYIAMEYMPGGSLEERLREHGALPVDEAVQVAVDVCEGLGCAHEEGVVHCDLKPQNILFDAEGGAKVGDFGIAHVSGEMLTRSWHTPAGFVAGTLPYMSPEQADGVRDDPRIDVYALGAVLYRMLAGRTYLDFDPRETPRSQSDNVQRIYQEQPRPPSTSNLRVTPWLDAVVLKALAKRPEDRFADAGAMRAALLQQRPAPLPLAPTKLAPAQPAAAPTPGGGSVLAAKKKAPLPAWFWPAVGGAVVLLIVLTIAIGAILDGGDGTATLVSQPTRTAALAATATLKAPQPGDAQTRSKDGMVMVYVPAGSFAMGSDEFDDEKPIHTVYLDTFWIDRTEVSNAQYRRCVEAGVCQVPTTCDLGDPTYDDGSKKDHPVVCVNWSQARTYCEWAGARLPTEAQWEKAARGTDGRTYPWGDSQPDCNRAQYGGCDGQTVPVGSIAAGTSPYGALDIAGNVWEWVADWYDADYYASSPERNPPGPATGAGRVLRGGSWGSHWYSVRAAYRESGYPPARSYRIGFRCAVSPGK
jgi:formylglycine-generating enzyme required for sulfatase activity